MGRLTVLPNDEEMLLTDLSFKVRKNFRPKKQFSKVWFLDCEFFLLKKSYQYPSSNSPLIGSIVEKAVGSFWQRYCSFGRPSIIFFIYYYFFCCYFWALFPFHPTGKAKKCCLTQKYSMGLLFVRVLPSNAPLDVLLKHHAKTVWSAFPKKVAFLARSDFTPLPVVKLDKLNWSPSAGLINIYFLRYLLKQSLKSEVT